MRPVSAEFPINQAFGSMMTAGVVGNINAPSTTVEYWVGRYGNYQPDGHAGCDFACPVGTPVYAMAAGTVLWADWGTKLPGDDSWGPNGYFRRWALYKGFPGIVTVIQHPGWIGVYAHLSDAPLNPGDKVTEGQRIATSGNTGGVDPHLHVEALIDLNYPTGNGLIYGRTNPEPFFNSTGLAAQAGTITPLSTPTESEEDFMGGLIDANQAEDICQRTADIIWERMNGKVLIHPVQAESMVQATTNRTAAKVAAERNGAQIDRGQADDIARAAARYTEEAGK